MSKIASLADFAFRVWVLRCYHCDRILPGKSKAEQLGDRIVVECPSCKLMTPFRLEKKAS